MSSKMKITHPAYDDMLGVWARCRDVAGGTRKMHAKGTEYLPMLTDEEQSDYQARLNRTVLYNATWRTIVGFLGLLFRKPATINVPAAAVEYTKDVTLTGVPLEIFALEVSEECLTVGRVGIWVNYPPVDTDRVTKADAQRLNLRPSMEMYKTEDILDWRVERVNNKMALTFVKLKEEVTQPKDEFQSVAVTQYRVLDLVAAVDGTYAYRVRIFQYDAGTDEDVQMGVDAYPVMNSEPMRFIPFFFVTPDDISPDVEEPPFIDLVDMNIAHYQVTADYENGCHWSGLPTIWVAGYTPPADEELRVGGGAAWCFPEANAKAGLLEVGTAGFSALEKNLDRKEAQMVILGARLLEVQKPGIEAAETAMIHRSGEQSILASMAQSISLGITAALATFVRWSGIPGSCSFALNRDFFKGPITSDELLALVKSWQTRGISRDTLFNMLKRGEVYDPNMTMEEEVQKILNDPAPPAAGGMSPAQTS